MDDRGSCPTCRGPLHQDADVLTCEVGHGFTLPELVRKRSELVVQAMWSAVRALEEEAAGVRLQAERYGDPRASAWARERELEADTVRELATRLDADRGVTAIAP